jgi:hypothetical protein
MRESGPKMIMRFNYNPRVVDIGLKAKSARILRIM